MEPFEIEVPVRFRDCDPMGHVNNAVYLTYFEIAREELWRRVIRSQTYAFILAEAAVTFRSPAKMGEVLKISLAVDTVGTKSWQFAYRIREASGREVATGHTVQVAFDYAAGKTQPIPADLREKLEALRATA